MAVPVLLPWTSPREMTVRPEEEKRRRVEAVLQALRDARRQIKGVNGDGGRGSEEGRGSEAASVVVPHRPLPCV